MYTHNTEKQREIKSWYHFLINHSRLDNVSFSDEAVIAVSEDDLQLVLNTICKHYNLEILLPKQKSLNFKKMIISEPKYLLMTK